jgi:hypothetical protein
MKIAVLRALIGLLSLSLLQVPMAHAEAARAQLHVYVTDSCIIADEPYYVPEVQPQAGADGMTPKFLLPLLGVVVGKLAELGINHEIQGSANRLKGRAARKDTRYALTKEANLYRADLQAAPVLHINAALGCMTIVAAKKMQPAGTDCKDAYIPKTLAPESMSAPEDERKTSRTDDSLENQLRRANVCVDGPVAAVYEARFEFSKDGTAYRFKNAGYRINSLLTTDAKGATRTTLYTLQISQPGATDQQEVLSSAWVNIGTVSAGAHAGAPEKDNAPWLRTPPLSAEARRAYEDKTKAQLEISTEIDSLKRSLARAQRVLDGLDQRIATSSADVAAGLQQERTKLAVQIQTQSAELDACNADFAELPHAPLEFMPVTIEVAVTETESEKKAQLAVADIIGNNSDIVAAAAANATSGIFSKSADPSDLKTEPDSAGGNAELARARDRYYSALTEAPAGGDAARRDLSLAKTQYNDARRALGLEPIR